MSKEIIEHPLPDFIIDFIGEQVAKHIGLFFASTLDKNQSILLYSFISEQYCLMIQRLMIEESRKKTPEVIRPKILPNFAKGAIFDTLHLFSKEHEIEENSLKIYKKYLDSFSVNFFALLLIRKNH